MFFIDFVHNVYLTVWHYFFGKKMINILDKLSDEEKDKFNKFKKNDMEFSKVIFALNNIPHKIHEIIFPEDNICHSYYQIYLNKLKKQNNRYDYILDYHNIDYDKFIAELNDEAIRYLFIRINLLNKQKLNKFTMNHVNCIVIDKLEKYILIFEPTYNIRFDLDIIKKILSQFSALDDYVYLQPSNIGYKYDTKLQKNDFFCQTYIIMIFYIITKNSHVNYKDFSTLFGLTINKETVGYFLYHIHLNMKNNGIQVNCPISWGYSDNYAEKITKYYINMIKELRDNMRATNVLKYDIDKEDEDLIIIDFKE